MSKIEKGDSLETIVEILDAGDGGVEPVIVEGNTDGDAELKLVIEEIMGEKKLGALRKLALVLYTPPGK